MGRGERRSGIKEREGSKRKEQANSTRGRNADDEGRP